MLAREDGSLCERSLGEGTYSSSDASSPLVYASSSESSSAYVRAFLADADARRDELLRFRDGDVSSSGETACCSCMGDASRKTYGWIKGVSGAMSLGLRNEFGTLSPPGGRYGASSTTWSALAVRLRDEWQ